MQTCYGKTLSGTRDLQSNACCDQTPPGRVLDRLDELFGDCDTLSGN